MRTAPVDLCAENVFKYFGERGRRHTALDGVDLVVSEGSRIGIVGESGSGKSTLSKILSGLQPASAGSVTYRGQDLGEVLRTRSGRQEFRQNVQYITQDTTSSFDPRRRLIESITAPLINLRDMSNADADNAALEMVERLGLNPVLAERYPHQVSGGQRQRFALARGLVLGPRILICDEVVSALDVSVQGAILNLIKAYCRDTEAALVFVSHGLPATAFITEELLVMKDGKVVESGPTRDVLKNPMDSYTATLVDAYKGGSAA